MDANIVTVGTAMPLRLQMQD